ncbi:hypothetical protein PTMSG1_10401 [Pyrenophora teres f. maculata]|nr:hypothetical protein PTMSG1_10401 [Pyrenophora teres f. maculata]
MKSAILITTLLASLAVANFELWCLKDSEVMPRDKADCSAADNKLCSRFWCINNCFTDARTVSWSAITT